jgi:hypothetical protein
MYSAFNSSQRFPQHISDLMIFESVEIEQEWIAKYLRQFMNSLLKILNSQITFRRSRNNCLVTIQQKIIGCTIENGFLL